MTALEELSIQPLIGLGKANVDIPQILKDSRLGEGLIIENDEKDLEMTYNKIRTVSYIIDAEVRIDVYCGLRDE